MPSLMGRTATRSASLVPPTAGSNRQPTASESNTPPDGLAHQRKQLPTQIGLQCLNLTNLMACARCRAQCIPAMPTRPSGRSATQDLIALTVRHTAMYICTAESIYTRGAIVRPYFVSSRRKLQNEGWTPRDDRPAHPEPLSRTGGAAARSRSEQAVPYTRLFQSLERPGKENTPNALLRGRRRRRRDRTRPRSERERDSSSSGKERSGRRVRQRSGQGSRRRRRDAMDGQGRCSPGYVSECESGCDVG